MSLLLPHSIDCTLWLRFPPMHPAIHPEALFCQWRLCRHRVGTVKRMLIFFHYPRGLPLHDGKLPIPSTTAGRRIPLFAGQKEVPCSITDIFPLPPQL